MIQQTPNPMLETSLAPITWALVADAAGARIFEFQKAALPWRLRDTLKGDGTGHPAQTADFGSKASNHKGALHGHGEDTPKETGERRLAHTLAQVLEKGLVERSFDRLVLVAPPKLLGELRENLSRGLQAKVVTEVHKDYVHLAIPDLMKHLGPPVGERPLLLLVGLTDIVAVGPKGIAWRSTRLCLDDLRVEEATGAAIVCSGFTAEGPRFESRASIFLDPDTGVEVRRMRAELTR